MTSGSLWNYYRDGINGKSMIKYGKSQQNNYK